MENSKKTVRILDKDYFKELKESLEEDFDSWRVGQFLSNSQQEILENSFQWSTTPQGHYYWRSLLQTEGMYERDNYRPLTEEDLDYLLQIANLRDPRQDLKIEDFL